MIRKKQLMVAMGLALVFMLALNAFADCRNRIRLMATPEGAKIQAEGQAEAREERGWERLRVQIEANVPDGTNFKVFVDDQLAGVITTREGEGQLRFDTQDGSLPAEFGPVCDLRTVDVVGEGDVLILHGEF